MVKQGQRVHVQLSTILPVTVKLQETYYHMIMQSNLPVCGALLCTYLHCIMYCTSSPLSTVILFDIGNSIYFNSNQMVNNFYFFVVFPYEILIYKSTLF